MINGYETEPGNSSFIPEKIKRVEENLSQFSNLKEILLPFPEITLKNYNNNFLFNRLDFSDHQSINPAYDLKESKSYLAELDLLLAELKFIPRKKWNELRMALRSFDTTQETILSEIEYFLFLKQHPLVTELEGPWKKKYKVKDVDFSFLINNIHFDFEFKSIGVSEVTKKLTTLYFKAASQICELIPLKKFVQLQIDPDKIYNDNEIKPNAEKLIVDGYKIFHPMVELISDIHCIIPSRLGEEGYLIDILWMWEDLGDFGKYLYELKKIPQDQSFLFLENTPHKDISNNPITYIKSNDSDCKAVKISQKQASPSNSEMWRTNAVLNQLKRAISEKLEHGQQIGCTNPILVVKFQDISLYRYSRPIENEIFTERNQNILTDLVQSAFVENHEHPYIGVILFEDNPSHFIFIKNPYVNTSVDILSQLDYLKPLPTLVKSPDSF